MPAAPASSPDSGRRRRAGKESDGQLALCGAGSDELWGDQGRDHFVCRRGFGADTIFDLVDGESIRILRAPRVVSDVTTASGMTAALVDFGGGDRLTLVGIQSSNLVIQPGLIVLA
jgi:hypothetical protein